MRMLFYLCASLSFGIIVGTFTGGVTRTIRSRSYTEQQQEKGRCIWNVGSRIMKYITLIFLMLGFIWCLYFLLLGIFYPEQSEYANNMSELIVAVLTVVSISFAFFEFIRKK